MTQEGSRRLAAVWFADIVGYTDLAARDEDLALRVVRELQRIARMQCDARGGRVVKQLGDAVLTVFDSADGAVRAALTLRDAFLQSPEVQSAGVSLRIGLHLGDVAEGVDGDIYGDAVNAASRIEDVAEAGQVVLSDVAYRLLQNRATIEVEDLGEHDLKGLGSVRLYAATLLEAGESVDLRDLLQDELAPLQLLDVAGVGGMGEIYLARDAGLRRTLAVKVLRSELVADKQARGRFFREAQIIAGLSHPNVIGVHSVGELRDGTPYFVMDYVEGGSLEDRLEQEGPLSVPETRRILGEVASALAAAHGRGVVHRDIKASNVLYDSESGRAIVTDWGIAALDPAAELAPETRLTSTGMVIGSPRYMSPEQLAGDEIGPASDLYSLGLLAFELLTGEGPFAAKTPHAIMVAHLREEARALSELRPEIDPEFEAIVTDCLLKSPADRPSAEEVSRRLSPDASSVLEWPPPGLEHLLGAAQKVALMLGGGFLLVAAPMLTGSLVASETHSAASGRLLPIHVLGLAFGTLLMLRGSWQLGRAGRSAVRAARLGYGWTTLVEVLSDRRGDAGLLLTGGREYASVSSTVRARLRRLRILRASLILCAAVALGPSAIVAVGISDQGQASRLGLLLALLGPSSALLLGALFAAREERTATAHVRRILRHRRAPIAALSPLISSWYDAFEKIRSGVGPGPGLRGNVWLGYAAATVAGGLLSIGAIAVIALTLMAVVGPVADHGVRRFSATRNRAERLRTAMPVRLESDSAITGRDAADLFIQMREVGSDDWWSGLPPASSIEGSPLVSGGSPYGPDHALVIDSLLPAAARGLSAAEKEYLGGFASDPRFPIFERLSRASGFDEVYMWERGAPEPIDWETIAVPEIPIPRLSSVREVAYHKVAQASLQLSNGNVQGAEQSLREMISFGLLLTEESTWLIASMIGAVIGGLGHENLQLLYNLTGRSDEAARIQPRTAEATDDLTVEQSVPSEMGDLLPFMQDTTVLRSLRFELLQNFLVDNTCYDASTILFGPPDALLDVVRGPLRASLVRYESEEALYDVHLDWEARYARMMREDRVEYYDLIDPTGSIIRDAIQAPWQVPRYLLRNLGSSVGRMIGHDRMSVCWRILLQSR